jgi:hypothetical protein
MNLYLYLISQTENNIWDTFDSAVVCAPDEETARNMDPANGEPMTWGETWGSWATAPKNVTVELIGTAAEGVRQGVVCASFNAG